jgi:hypothetical protein
VIERKDEIGADQSRARARFDGGEVWDRTNHASNPFFLVDPSDTTTHDRQKAEHPSTLNKFGVQGRSKNVKTRLKLLPSICNLLGSVLRWLDFIPQKHRNTPLICTECNVHGSCLSLQILSKHCCHLNNTQLQVRKLCQKQDPSLQRTYSCEAMLAFDGFAFA